MKKPTKTNKENHYPSDMTEKGLSGIIKLAGASAHSKRLMPVIVVGPIPDGNYSFVSGYSDVEVIKILEEIVNDLKEKRKNIN